MKETNSSDHIDVALSNTYFKNSSGKKTFNAPKKTNPGKQLWTVLAAVAVVSLLIVFVKLGKTPVVESTKVEQTGPVEGVREEASLEPRVFYDFEKDSSGWEIPFWAVEKPDHVGEKLEQTGEMASSKSGSLKLSVNFPGGRWTAALVEITQYLDFGNYDRISADIYVPESCPRGLRAKLILTVGEDWQWVEMARTSSLVPGEWNTISANIAEESFDWRRTVVDADFKTDVRKVAIRIESNNKPVYSGPVYIDNIQLWEAI